MIGKPKDKDWVWDRYWRFDRIASCFDSAGSNYPAEFEAEWSGLFRELPRGAVILDLCTGNGAIARMAAKFSKNSDKSFKITGVDRAGIDPDKFVTSDGNDPAITYLGGVSAERLPFEDASFDAVISQYGFEYTDHDKTLAEISRVLKPGGRGKLICHAAEGAPAANGRVEVKNITTVTNDLDLFRLAGKAIAAAWGSEKEGRELSSAEKQDMKAFGAAMGGLSDALEKEPNNPFLQAAYGLLQHTFKVREHFPLATLMEKIEDTRAETQAHLGRIRALLEASLTEDNCRALKQALESYRFGDVLWTRFALDGGAKLVGWNFEFSRVAQ